jgi:MoaA/NifB/PqqE/SkfB family radical SAM enzyme
MDCSDVATAPVTWHDAAPRRRPGEDASRPLRALPLAILYLTERCNSRCTSCDWWRHGRLDMSVEAVRALLPDLAAKGTRAILVSGGEPLMNPHWPEIARLLRGQGLRLWLLTAGLALAKHAREVRACFDDVTVSLDATTREAYAAIRGVDAFDKVCEGIRALVARGLAPGLRVTVQRGNFAALPAFVPLARALGAAHVSFLAADVANAQAFGRAAGEAVGGDVALRPEDLAGLSAAIDALARDHAAEVDRGFVQESIAKLRRLEAYYRAVCGLGPYPPVRCNAPEFSAVVEADGQLRPCFFIPGPPGVPGDEGLGALESPAMQRLRADIRAGRRAECTRCVCAKWQDLDAMEAFA